MLDKTEYDLIAGLNAVRSEMESRLSRRGDTTPFTTSAQELGVHLHYIAELYSQGRSPSYIAAIILKEKTPA